MTPTDDRDPVDVLAEEFADRLRRGEHPSVADFAARHPDHADQLRELLPAVARMEQLKRFRRSAEPAEPTLPDRLGDFRIVRELGRGGMGVVFEAVQESLGRRVALKVLSAHAQLDAGRRARFVREAKAAARLHHTNIVPVFGVGEHAGLPYYVMQLIPGRGLNAVIDGWRRAARRRTPVLPAGETIPNDGVGTGSRNRPTTGDDAHPAEGPRHGDWRFTARLALQAADALQYAHDQGVLHRDVKPANLLLDDTRRLWVVDFGLAKLVDHHGLTATGDILGTLQYLAPECLNGDADPRSDVYGLGATLYELLTLEPPFASSSPVRLMKQLAEADPPPPRAVNPAVPRDLETIVLKAMAREPDRRYASAELMADDLRAFLEDRPIAARRSTGLDRARRWCRRNPLAAALSFTTFSAMVLAAVLGWAGYVKTSQALEAEAKRRGEAERAQREAEKAKADAEEASRRLAANLELSLEAFEKVFEAAGGADGRPGFGPGLPPRPGPGGTGFPPGAPFVAEAADKAAVLEAVLEFYDRFAERNATQPRLRLDAAKANRRVGEAHRWLGRGEKADASFRRAAGLLDALHAEYPDEEEVRFELVRTLTDLAAGQPTEAEGLLLRAVDLGRPLAVPPRRWAVGTAHLRLGAVRESAGDRPGAEAEYREAVSLLGPEPGRGPRPPHVVVECAAARHRLAGLLARDRRLPEARRWLEEAAGELRPAAQAGGPPSRPARELLAEVANQLADLCERVGDRPAADRARAEARQASQPPPDGGRPGGPGGPPGGPKGGFPGKGPDGPPPKP